jgi:hypothetical protein
MGKANALVAKIVCRRYTNRMFSRIAPKHIATYGMYGISKATYGKYGTTKLHMAYTAYR